MKGLKPNVLYYGDNLPVLREHIPDESIDLIYLDPPFNSNRSYNVLFKEAGGTDESPAQIEAFEDTWHWGDAAQEAFEEIALHGTDDTARLLHAMVDALGHNDVTAYLSMMAIRLVELRRVLKTTGSIYLHCDPTASHYLKVMMDSIFGPRNFRNEIVWHYSGWNKKLKGKFESRSDTILFYAKGSAEKQTFNSYSRQWASVDEYVKVRKQAVRQDDDGRSYVLSDAGAGKRVRRYLDEAMNTGAFIDNVWDIDKLNNSSAERLGYPTQKPLRLLERIVAASSNAGDIVLDPFCGCGTAVHAAQKLGREWIGIDITTLAVNLIVRRMEDAFPALKDNIAVEGHPVDLPGAQQLADKDKYQFQWWVLGRIGALPAGGDRKKGMDRGIDGVIPFMEGLTERRRVLVSVKGGGITSGHVRDLKGVLDREGAPIGVLVTMKPPTREMKTEAASAGSYISEIWGTFPKLQMLTVADVLNGKKVQMPPHASPFAQAPKEVVSDGEQKELEL